MFTATVRCIMFMFIVMKEHVISVQRVADVFLIAFGALWKANKLYKASAKQAILVQIIN